MTQHNNNNSHQTAQTINCRDPTKINSLLRLIRRCINVPRIQTVADSLYVTLKCRQIPISTYVSKSVVPNLCMTSSKYEKKQISQEHSNTKSLEEKSGCLVDYSSKQI